MLLCIFVSLFGTMNKKKQAASPDEMNFFEHLEVLRWHIIRSLAAVVVFAIVVFLFKDFVFRHIILAPKYDDFLTYRVICRFIPPLCFQPPDFMLITRELGEEFFVHLKSSFWIGLIMAFPYVFYEFWSFVKPGLYKKEQKAARGIVFVCSLLFVAGVLFGYFIISPFAINFLGNYSVGATKTTTLASYVGYMTMFTLPAGLIFELPVVIYFLAKIGLITAEFMKKYRKHAIVAILVLAAVFTPPDIITQFLIGIPLYILYEISIHIAKRVQAKSEP